MTEELACIVCSDRLVHVNVEGQLVPTCTRHGAWFQEPQLRSIVADDRDEATPEQEQVAWSASDPEPEGLTTERFRTCPVCANTLRKDVWTYGSGIVVDTCDEHGIWVDNGELERIEAWQEAVSAHDQPG